MVSDRRAFQDQMHGNHCFGCGADNPQGLRIKSFWSAEDEAECRFTPQPHHCAGPLKYLNGGVISTLIDCHCICTALAEAYRLACRDIGTGERIWFVTGSLEISYRKPVPIDHEVVLTATLGERTEKKTWLDCRLFSRGQLCAEGKVLAVKVPTSWFEAA